MEMTVKEGSLELSATRKLVVSSLLVGVAVVLSPLYFPFGPTKCYPFQHMVNALAGVLLGPWWAALVAVSASVIRNLTGMGTLFAFPGSIPGALAVGLAARFLPARRRAFGALFEPLGTALVGAYLASTLVAPAVGRSVATSALVVAFGASSVPGSLLGFALILLLQRVSLLASARSLA